MRTAHLYSRDAAGSSRKGPTDLRDEDLGLACPNNMSSTASASHRTWFITGCSSGFGRAIAEAALQAGDRVVLTARDVSTIEPLAAVVPEQALALALDVTQEDQIHAALDAAVERFGPLDVVVNKRVRILDRSGS